MMAVGSYNVCNKSDAADPGVISCAGDYSTANLNNYIYTQHSGTPDPNPDPDPNSQL